MLQTWFGTGIGPMVLGIMLTAFGFRDMYLMCAMIAVASLIMYWAVHGVKTARRA